MKYTEMKSDVVYRLLFKEGWEWIIRHDKGKRPHYGIKVDGYRADPKYANDIDAMSYDLEPDIREATSEEIVWLELCHEAETFLPKPPTDYQIY